MPDDLLDPLDPREPAVARRVRDFSVQAVRPIDAAAIARSSIPARRSPVAWLFGPAARLGWVAVAGILLAVAVAPRFLGVATPGTTPDASPGATPVATPAIITDPGIPACTNVDVDAVITGWEGAAGSTIATVELRNTAGFECFMWRVGRPILTAMGDPLIVGETGPAGSGTIVIGPSDVLTTLVRASNYCGPQPAANQLPVTIQVVQGSEAFTATPIAGSGATGVPPCNGEGQAATIEMQPWALRGSQ
jgi:hypothetical protein